jgi:Spy/CpxP family protein refolding chaperone
MKRSCLTLIALSILLSGSLLLSFGSDLAAQPFGGHHGGGPGRGFFSNLTDEQREAVRELMAEMHEQGATREEIHGALAELFQEWGLELPERPSHRNGPHGPRGAGRDGNGFWEELTEEQRAVIRSRILELWQDGAAKPEIHDAVREMLSDYGIEFPERPRSPRHRDGRGRPHFEFMSQLSEEQRKEIREMVQEMRDQDATREEIRAAVEQKLAGWGIELPGPPPELTVEQRKALRAVVFELWQNGATRGEIRSAVAEQFENWGLQMPEHGCGHFGIGPLEHVHKCLRPELTQEQRETMHETVRELRRQGATPEEIHEAVEALLADFGIDLPDLSALTDEQRATLHTSALDLWLSGATRSEICETIKELLADFDIEWPEDSGSIDPARVPGTAAIWAQNYPNPANPETQIHYTLNVRGEVQIQIYNISGQLVRAFDMGYLQPGSYSVTWDGRGLDGLPVASGVYLYKVQAGLHSVTNRMVLLK